MTSVKEHRYTLKNKISHKRANFVLAIAVCLLGLYLVLTPLLPAASHTVRPTPAVTPVSKENIPTENRLIIPTSKVDTQVVEGADISVINNGNVWRRPATSNDPTQGNMVIVGHNYTYRDPTPPFYALNDSQINNDIFLYWQGKKYVYKVTTKKIVEPTAVEIEQPTAKPTLTLYTCYPLFVANKGLVIQAELQQ